MIAAQLGPLRVYGSCQLRSNTASMLLARRALAPVASRSMYTRVMAAAAGSSEPARGEGVKAALYEILTDAKPMTSAEIWEQAQNKGVKSKRHMKVVLQDLRARGWVITKPGAVAAAKRDKAFRYQLSEKTLNSPRFKGKSTSA